MQVTLFLDVDGVLSPVRGPSVAWSDWAEMPFNDYSVLLSRSMAERLAALPVRIVWLTSWRQLANIHIGAWLGWATHEVAEPEESDDDQFWKVRVVRAHAQSRRGPFIWIDDDMAWMATQIEDLLADSPHLLIAPDPAIGLTPQDLHRVEEFLKEVAARGETES